MKKIIAKFKNETIELYRDDNDDIYIPGKMKYWKLYPDNPKCDEYAEIIEIDDENENLIGYAYPVYFVLNGVIYNNPEECAKQKDFDPKDVIICRKNFSEIAAFLQRDIIKIENMIKLSQFNKN